MEKTSLRKEFWLDGRVLFISTMFVIYTVAACLSLSLWSPVALVAGVVLFFCAEYFIHRYLLHPAAIKLMPSAIKGHDKHHDDPTNMKFLLTPNTYNVPYHGFLWIALILIWGNFYLASSMMVGFSAYHLMYEWTHFVSHRPIVPRTLLGRWMKKVHLLHHFKDPDQWYGVTHPVFDKVMHTDKLDLPKADQSKDKHASM
ncbi:sterol desaturase family protein [Paenibacillus sp. N1-5-1-14]|uniref:sterol desaturase family protein n=1 Tax=Paenibacillus radicibacter TaxID=2972488 RepID=UPI0021591195|nr:sterol desaturase family protein [Paenibacillus radicibacter]MCR8642802.1 sterol desaturase family protein [Paenibacillus radicibacter]